MIIQSSKKMSKCTKEELILLLRGEIENRSKLIKLLEKNGTNIMRKSRIKDFPNIKALKRYLFLAGMETAINSVKRFYEIK